MSAERFMFEAMHSAALRSLPIPHSHRAGVSYIRSPGPKEGELNEVVQRFFHLVDAAENIASEMERLRVLKEHELGVRVEEAAEGHGPYVPRGEVDEE